MIVEGLWVFYPPWGLPDDIYQIKVLVKASAKNRQYRVGNVCGNIVAHGSHLLAVARHVAGGIEGGRDAALRRYLDNDKPNGELVLSTLPLIDYVIDNNTSLASDW